MLEIIRRAVAEALSQWQLTDYTLGVVEKTLTLQLKLRDDLYLTKENLIMTDKISDLTVGDKLVLLRVMRGQKYIVLSKVVAE